MTLKEVVEMYGLFNSDYDLIKKFFTINNCEEEAIKMLTEFSQKVIKDKKDYIWFLKEHTRYGHVLMINKKVDIEDRIKLMSLHQSYIDYGRLEKDSLKQAKEIFDRYDKSDFIAIDMFFLGYLQRNGIGLYLNDCSQEINKYEVKENE